MISIIILAHNEEEHIYYNIKKFIDEAKDLDYEIILVENGSTDETLQICRKLEADTKGLIRVVSLRKPSYGVALKRGINEAKGEYLFILEADYIILNFVREGLRLLREGPYEVIVASKRHPESTDKRGYKRRVLTWGFNNLLRLRLKAFTIQSAKHLINLSETEGEALQTELILLSQIYNIPSIEIPIQIEEIRAPTISILRRVPKVVSAILDIWKSVRAHKKIVRTMINL